MNDVIVFGARVLIVVPIVVAVYSLLRLRKGKRRRFVVYFVGISVISIILAIIASSLYWHPRPFISDGVKPLFVVNQTNGFPSMHSLWAAILAFTVLSVSLRWGVFLLMAAFLVGWARVAAGVHHLTDVSASFVIAGAAYLFVEHWYGRLSMALPNVKRTKSR